MDFNMEKTIYTHINTGAKLIAVQGSETSKTIDVVDEENLVKTMQLITLRRWYKKQVVVEEEPVEVTPVEAAPVEAAPVEVVATTNDAQELPSAVQAIVERSIYKGYCVDYRKTYVRIYTNESGTKKTLAEVYYSKRKGTFYIACRDAVVENLRHIFVNLDAVKVPESYGWSLNNKVKFGADVSLDNIKLIVASLN